MSRASWEPMYQLASRTLALLVSLALLGGCSQGFKSANDLENDERGPKECRSSCASVGMHMSAFVLFEHEHSGCVCSPGASAAPGESGSAAVAAGHAVLMQEEQERQQRQAQQNQATTSYQKGTNLPYP